MVYKDNFTFALALPLPFLLLSSVNSFQTGHNLTLLQLGQNSSAIYSIICSAWKVWKCDHKKTGASSADSRTEVSKSHMPGHSGD
jgi:hypothetical protein